jgi:hypothetical protein
MRSDETLSTHRDHLYTRGFRAVVIAVGEYAGKRGLAGVAHQVYLESAAHWAKLNVKVTPRIQLLVSDLML